MALIDYEENKHKIEAVLEMYNKLADRIEGRALVTQGNSGYIFHIEFIERAVDAQIKKLGKLNDKLASIYGKNKGGN